MQLLYEWFGQRNPESVRLHMLTVLRGFRSTIATVCRKWTGRSLQILLDDHAFRKELGGIASVAYDVPDDGRIDWRVFGRG